MANRSKIQDRAEAIAWLEEGRTYAWMRDEYLRKYQIDTSISMWSNLRRSLNLPGRQTVPSKSLTPWSVRDDHRFKYTLSMLRLETRRRAGNEMSEDQSTRLSNWKSTLTDPDGTRYVVHYEPETEEGFFLVPAREGIDTDLIRVPDAV